MRDLKPWFFSLVMRKLLPIHMHLYALWFFASAQVIVVMLTSVDHQGWRTRLGHF